MSREQRAEKWRTFMRVRFFPEFWREIKPRFFSTIVGVITAVLILLAQIHFGVITSGARPRILSILWPYVLVALAFTVYHLARTPWLISNSHLDTVVGLKKDISERDITIAELRATICTRDEEIKSLKTPKRSTAEQHAVIVYRVETTVNAAYDAGL